MRNPFQGIVDGLYEVQEKKIAERINQEECRMCGALHEPKLCIGGAWFCSEAHYDEWRQFEVYEREWEK
jgi:hypothetical protein